MHLAILQHSANPPVTAGCKTHIVGCALKLAIHRYQARRNPCPDTGDMPLQVKTPHLALGQKSISPSIQTTVSFDSGHGRSTAAPCREACAICCISRQESSKSVHKHRSYKPSSGTTCTVRNCTLAAKSTHFAQTANCLLVYYILQKAHHWTALGNARLAVSSNFQTCKYGRSY